MRAKGGKEAKIQEVTAKLQEEVRQKNKSAVIFQAYKGFIEPGLTAEYKMNQPGAIHVCFEVEDLPAICDRMEKAGIEFLGPYHQVSIEPKGPFMRRLKLEEASAAA